MGENEILDPEIVESMGISQPAFEEVQAIIGRMPTIEELSTLLAMWKSNGQQQNLYGWLKGQHHVVEKNEYLYQGNSTLHKEIREPRVKDCLEIAHNLYHQAQLPHDIPQFQPSSEIFLVGNISSEFLNSEYAKQYLHLVENPVTMGNAEEDIAYQQMILDVLKENGAVQTIAEVGEGGLFGTMLASCKESLVGFDILCCREVRLDAFLFGEEPGRLLATIPDTQEDFFLLKMDEARINSCFLGRTTKGRIVVDGMDFGPVQDYFR